MLLKEVKIDKLDILESYVIEFFKKYYIKSISLTKLYDYYKKDNILDVWNNTELSDLKKVVKKIYK